MILITSEVNYNVEESDKASFWCGHGGLDIVHTDVVGDLVEIYTLGGGQFLEIFVDERRYWTSKVIS